MFKIVESIEPPLPITLPLPISLWIAYFIPGWLANVNTYKPEKGVATTYIGRPGKWGNPFPVSKYGRLDAIARFEVYLQSSGLVHQIHELSEMVLLCHCHPLPCHGSVLLKYL